MRRWTAVVWQASFLAIAGVLYFLFVLPRWHELSGEWSHTLGTAMRIVAGVLVGLAALPPAFTWLKTRKPEYGTPTLALTLRVASIALHVLAGVLIVGAAIAEIWLSLDKAGQWLFGVYGAAAAIALLGAFSFYLAFVAELPPPPPKPLKAKQPKRGRSKQTADGENDADGETADADTTDTDTTDTDTTEPADTDFDAEAEEVTAEVEAPAVDAEATVEDVESEAVETAQPEGVEADAGEEQTGRLRNRRPGGKTSRLRGRSRGGVAVED